MSVKTQKFNPVSKKLAGIVAVMGLMTAAPASAQLGSVNGSVGGTVNGTTRATTRTRINSKTRVGVKTPDSARIRVTAPARATVRTSQPRRTYYNGTYYYDGGHYHGGYYHTHGRFGEAHFHDDFHSHDNGYAKVVVKIESRPQDIGPLLEYGTPVRSKKGKNLGEIRAMMRLEDGVITHILTTNAEKPIPVGTLRADGDVLFTSMKRKKLQS